MRLEELLFSRNRDTLIRQRINNFMGYGSLEDENIDYHEIYYLTNGIYITFLDEKEFIKVINEYFKLFDYHLFKHIKIGDKSFMIFKNNIGDYVFVSYSLLDGLKIVFEGEVAISFDIKNISFSISYCSDKDIRYIKLLPIFYVFDKDLIRFFVVRDFSEVIKNILNRSEKIYIT